MKTLILNIAFIGIAVPMQAQKSYTLEQCRQMALEKNIAVRNADRAVQAADEQKREAFTKYFPTVSAAGMTAKLDKDLLGLIDGGTIAGVSAVQPVFAGGQIVNGNKLARLGVDVSRIQREQQQDQVGLTAEKYFWQTVTLEEKLNTLNRVYAMLERLEKDVQASVAAGVAMRNDLLQIQLRQNEVESSRIKLRNGISISKMVMAQYVGIEDSVFSLQSGVSTDELPRFPMEIRQNHESALKNTTEYRLLEKNVEGSVLQRRMETGKYLPTLGVGASYSYMNMMNRDHRIGMVFAAVSVPVSGWWGGYHAIKRKKIEEQTAREQLQDSSEQLLIRMQKEWNDVEDAYKQLALMRKSIEQSEENLRLNNDYYRAGTSTMSDLLDAQMLYQQARDGYVEAYSEYQTKIQEYKIATGL